MQMSEWMLTELQSENAMTRSLLQKLTNESLAWKPSEELHSIGWNAAHLVETLSWLPGILTHSEFDIAPPGQEPYTTPEATDVSSLLELFEQNAATAKSSLAGVPDSAMHDTWSLKMAGQTFFTLPKGECIQKWVFSHSAHHRGILSVYMRMAGIPVSSVYEG